MSDFVLRAVLGIKDDASGPAARIGNYFVNLKEKIKGAEGGLESFNKHMGNLKSGMKDLAIGTAASIAVKSVVSPARDLNKELGTLEGVSGATGEELKKLKSAALEAGLSTNWKSNEAAAGLTELASAGMSTERSMKSLIPTLDLATAAAGKITVGDSAALMGSVMNSWKLAGDQASHTADVFVKMGDLTNFSIDELSGAFRGVTMIAPMANQELEGTAAVMMSIRSAGATSVAAGEKLRMALSSLMTPSSNAKQALQALGVSTRDSVTGEMRSMIDIFSDMQNKMKNATPAQRDYYVSTILGAEGMSAYNATMGAMAEVTENGVTKTLKGVDAVRYWESSLKTADGAARRFASLQENTLAGSETKLSTVWVTLKTLLGDALVPALTQINKLFVAILTPIARLVKESAALRTAIAWIIPAVAGFTLLAGAIKITNATIGLYTILSKAAGKETFSLLGSIKNIIPSIRSLSVVQWALNTAFLGCPVVWIIGGLVALGVGIYALVKKWDTVKAAFTGAWNSIKNAWGNAPGWFKGIVALVLLPFWPFIQLGKLIVNNWGSIKTFFSGLFDTVASVFTKIWEVVSGVLGKIWEKIQFVWEPIKSGLTTIGELFFGDVEKQAEKAGKGMMTAYGKGIKSNMDVPLKAVNSVHKEIQANHNQSDAKKGPLSNTSKWGRSFVATWAGGVDREARSTDVVRKFVTLQAKQINAQSPVIQKIASRKTEAKNLLGSLNVKVDGKDMTVDKLAGMLAQVISQELNRVTAV